MRNSKSIGFAVLLISGIAIWVLLQENDHSDNLGVDLADDFSEAPRPETGTDTQERETRDSTEFAYSAVEKVPTMEPLDVRAFREARGYYGSGGNDIGAKHPYEYMDDEALQALADQQDGLAQLILADRLSNSDIEKAMPMYLEAAVNGKTAALVNMASSRLVRQNNPQGFGFELTNESGRISDEYLEILRYYAAAEMLGDFVGTEMLNDHILVNDLTRYPDNLARICALGLEVKNNIETVRTSRWGDSSVNGDSRIDSLDISSPLCESISR